MLNRAVICTVSLRSTWTWEQGDTLCFWGASASVAEEPLKVLCLEQSLSQLVSPRRQMSAKSATADHADPPVITCYDPAVTRSSGKYVRQYRCRRQMHQHPLPMLTTCPHPPPPPKSFLLLRRAASLISSLTPFPSLWGRMGLQTWCVGALQLKVENTEIIKIIQRETINTWRWFWLLLQQI